MPLNSDPNALSDEEYHRRWQERINQYGDEGLHQIPDKYLETPAPEGPNGEAR